MVAALGLRDLRAFPGFLGAPCVVAATLLRTSERPRAASVDGAVTQREEYDPCLRDRGGGGGRQSGRGEIRPVIELGLPAGAAGPG